MEPTSRSATLVTEPARADYSAKTNEAFAQVMPLLRAMTEVTGGGDSGILSAEGVHPRAPHTR